MNSLFLEIIQTRFRWRVLIFLTSFASATMALISPFFQKNFLDLLNQTRPTWNLFELTQAQTLWVAFLTMIFALALNQLTNYMAQRESFLMQKQLADKIYQHTLSLRVDTLATKPVGEIVSLYATDVPGATVFLDQTLPYGFSTVIPLVLAPFAIQALFSIPLAPLLGTMAVVIVFNTIMAYRQSRFFFLFKHLAAERIGLVNEWVQNIRTLRILRWVESFESKIFEKREIETTNRVRMVTNGQVMNSVSSSITFLLNIIAITLVVKSIPPEQLRPSDLFILLWIVAVFLVRPFRQMPWFFTFAFDSWTSIKRLSDFLETQKESSDHTAAGSLLPVTAESSTSIKATDIAVNIEGLNLEIKGHKILKDFKVRIKKGEFVAIVGEVSSGKTMLLYSLLKETKAQFSKYEIFGQDMIHSTVDEVRSHFAFVPQEGFIMNASLRENVAFLYEISSEVDSEIRNSLSLSQFDLTTDRVESGLDTHIGERGVNLSGGQKQRVSLARVHYHPAEILLLDDCLSALDVDTEEKLFSELLLGHWKKKTRLLVTHRFSALQKVDQVLYLKNGTVADFGTLAELLLRNEDFREFTRSMNEVSQ